jgi:hypothetical protein
LGLTGLRVGDVEEDGMAMGIGVINLEMINLKAIAPPLKFLFGSNEGLPCGLKYQTRLSRDARWMLRAFSRTQAPK